MNAALLHLAIFLGPVLANPFFGYNYEKPICPYVPPEIVYTTVWEQAEPQTVYLTSTFPVPVPVYEMVTLTVPSPPEIIYETVTSPVYQTVTLPPQILPAQTVYSEVTRTAVCDTAPSNYYLPPEAGDGGNSNY